MPHEAEFRSPGAGSLPPQDLGHRVQALEQVFYQLAQALTSSGLQPPNCFTVQELAEAHRQLSGVNQELSKRREELAELQRQIEVAEARLSGQPAAEPPEQPLLTGTSAVAVTSLESSLAERAKTLAGRVQETQLRERLGQHELEQAAVLRNRLARLQPGVEKLEKHLTSLSTNPTLGIHPDVWTHIRELVTLFRSIQERVDQIDLNGLTNLLLPEFRLPQIDPVLCLPEPINGSTRVNLRKALAEWAERLDSDLTDYFRTCEEAVDRLAHDAEDLLQGDALAQFQDRAIGLHVVMYQRRPEQSNFIMQRLEQPAGEILEALGVETIIPKPGTRFDEYSHEISDEEYSTGYVPYTVIRVKEPGYRKPNGIVEKAKVDVSSDKRR